ncbi:hypothetical protein MMB232_02324 [Brevundimonas subvibrioides]|uniref:alpha/beta hydrolase n=1 Tax=Brevundimonas subvibrioides TaxID=74313 RepID=UPI0032D56D4C
MKPQLLLTVALLSLSGMGTAQAQIANPPLSAPPVAVEGLGGPYPVVMEMDPSLADHTIYRPADMAAVGHPLPLVAHGAGACLNVGNMTPQFLGELASYGYLVVTGGPIIEGADAPMTPGGGGGVMQTATQNRTAQLLETIDWAIAQNDVTDGRFEGRIAADKIAVIGHSCGGLQAIAAADDPRVTTAIIGNSGIIRTPPADDTRTGRSYRPAGVDDLKRIHTPILYVSGGPTDQAQPNAILDVQAIEGVPIFHADIGTGHGGTYREPRGGDYAGVMKDWLNWQLLGDTAASRTFVGADCRLCTDDRWTVERKNID